VNVRAVDGEEPGFVTVMDAVPAAAISEVGTVA
jgi:hypothetical protein